MNEPQDPPELTSAASTSGSPASLDDARNGRPLWELELLISGALIFSLFRIPGILQDVFFRIEAQISLDLFLGPFLLFYFGNLAVLVLIISFSIHFLLRSFWVALAGLNDVFPEGIDWQRLDLAPVAGKISRQFPKTTALEHKLDRIASTVFSVLFFIVLQVLFLFIIFAVMLAILAPLRSLLAPELRPDRLLWIALAIAFGPLLISSLIDRWFKKGPARLERWPRLARMVEKVMRAHHRVFLSGLYVPIQLTFASRFSTRATSIASVVSIVSVVILFLISFLAGQGAVGFDAFVFFPEGESPNTVSPSHYESSSSGRAPTIVPTIQSEIVGAPYVRLFIPYQPRRDKGRMAEECPEVEPLRGEGFFLRRKVREAELTPEREAELLRCLGSLYRVEINGEAIEPAYSFYRRPSDDLRGLLAYLSTEDLPRGRNLLVVSRSPTEKRLARAEDEAERRRLRRRDVAYIPFWL